MDHELWGLQWLDELVKKGTATMESGGYPFRYTAAARDILPKLRGGPPRHDGPMVIGDDYVFPGGWPRDVKIDWATISSCMPEEELVVEAWDLS